MKRTHHRRPIQRCVSYQVVWQSGSRDIEYDLKALIAKRCRGGCANEGGGAGFAWWTIEGGAPAQAMKKEVYALCKEIGAPVYPLPFKMTGDDNLDDFQRMAARYLAAKRK